MNTRFKRGLFLFSSFFLLSMIVTVSGQPDQTIYYQYCVAQPDTSCFQPIDGTIDSVGRDVAALGGNFRFCLQLDTIDSGYAPVRVVMVLDNSRSMCQNPTGACCADGDSSGNCMMNDPTNQRIEAAHIFVDSLRAINPESEIGIVVYAQSASPNGPLPLTSDQNVERIHSWIDRAACTTTGGIGKAAKTTETYLGLGLDAGLKLVDNNYSTLNPIMARHVILLTDGAWDDINERSPDTLITRYKTTYPDRKVPTVHGVFLSDSLLHVTHLYPWQGCSNTDSVNLSYLEHTAALTGGMYFPGSTPQNIINNFLVLLDSVTQTVPQQLVGLTVTNITNGQSSTNSARPSQISNSVATWQASLKSLPLVTGPNLLEVRSRIYRPGSRDTLDVVTKVTIIRSDRYREAIDTDLFKEFCNLVSAKLTITASPARQPQNEPFDVKATISDASNFQLDTTQIRIFTRFPDNEDGVIATFHLDGTTNNATGGKNGVGTPSFTASAQLFGSGAITAGSFSYLLPQLAANFVMEEWVNPGTNAAGVLFSGNGIEIGVNAEMKLYFKSGSEVIVAAVIPLDDAVWSHIGIVRTNGTIQLFINGIAVSEAVANTTPITGGDITISVPNQWVIDEVRFTNKSRVVNEAGNPTLTIPTIPSTGWSLAGVNSKGEVLKVPAAAWTGGTQLALQFSSPVSGRVLVNIRQKNAGSIGSGWSKNSNPVEVADDLVGPFVKKGILTPAEINGATDTLLIEFSEPVNCARLKEGNLPENVFTVSNGSVDQNAKLKNSVFVDSTNCVEEYILTVTLTVPKGKIKPGVDSIRLSRATVTDAAGNPAQTNQKGEIVWGKGLAIEITGMLTEANKNLEIPQVVKNVFGIKNKNNGKVVGINSRRELGSSGIDPLTNDSTYGLVSIYDPVGNLVRNDLPVFKAKDPRFPLTYYILWDGTNRWSKRRVGSGAYLAIFKSQYSDGSKIIEKKKIVLRW